ncbi:hypothetical protein O6H91_20G074300 [Diphasiastrum complanatum]|uniref:Uncharacterized protein n=1 Tax=Diphasiastrum complanatum TaxID=34168 RepID=A0ACC2ARY9_DIPCM|nr:hypothetical protein O6H91_20G074300 [Diphasiastrum complanatum]
MDQQTLSKQRGLAKSPDIILIAFKNLDYIPFTERWTLFDWISYDPLPKRAGSRLQCEEWSITELLSVLKEAQVAFLKCQKDSISIDGFRLREEIRLKLMDTIGTSNSLTSVTIDRVEGSDLLALCRNLGANTVLQELSISWPWYCREDGVQFVCEMLNKNSTLRRLSLRRSYVGATGAAFLATMLRENSTLKRLSLWGNPLGPEGVQFLLKPLVTNNASLTHLEIGGFENRMGSSGTQSVAEVLNSNSTLIELVISYEDSMSPEALCCIFKSLEKSKSLQVLDLSFCDGVRGDVFPSIMDLLQVNHWLKTINLTETPLEREGLEAAVRAQLERNAQKHVTVMRELPVTHPTSARIFLCGHAFSGKTTLGRSMVRSFATDVCTKMVRPLLELIEVRKPSGCFTDPNEWATRTHGIEIKVLVDDGKHKISIWDLAGQEEYQVFHDFMIPDLSTQGSPCCFLLLCNPFERESGQQKQFEVIKQELSYWVRFISSNTRRSMTCQPQVAVVLTHCDKPIVGKEVVKKHVEMLKNDFQNYLNMSLNPYFVNAHSSREVKTLAEDVRSTCIKILGLLPHVYEACVHMRYALSQWNKKHPDQPMITKQSFNDHFFSDELGVLWRRRGC